MHVVMGTESAQEMQSDTTCQSSVHDFLSCQHSVHRDGWYFPRKQGTMRHNVCIDIMGYSKVICSI